MSGGGEGRASPGGTGRQQGSGPHSDPGCGVPGPPSAHLAHSPTYIPGEGVCGQAQGDEERHAGGQPDGLRWGWGGEEPHGVPAVAGPEQLPTPLHLSLGTVRSVTTRSGFQQGFSLHVRSLECVLGRRPHQPPSLPSPAPCSSRASAASQPDCRPSHGHLCPRGLGCPHSRHLSGGLRHQCDHQPEHQEPLRPQREAGVLHGAGPGARAAVPALGDGRAERRGRPAAQRACPPVHHHL